jgi:hypothetical protein
LTAKAKGLTVFDVKITLDNNIDIKNQKRYFIPIDATIYLPELVFDSISEIMDTRITDLNNTIQAKQYYLELTVLPPLTLQQHLGKFVSDLIVPISGLWALLAAIGAVVIPITIRMYKRKDKKRAKKNLMTVLFNLNFDYFML